jgi:Cutinase
MLTYSRLRRLVALLAVLDLPTGRRLVLSTGVLCAAAAIVAVAFAAANPTTTAAKVRACGASSSTPVMGVLWATPDVSCALVRTMDAVASSCNSDPAVNGPQTTTCNVSGFACTLSIELDYRLTRCLRGPSIVEIAVGGLTPPDGPKTSHAGYLLPPKPGAVPFPACPVIGVIGSRGSGESEGSSAWDLGLGQPSHVFALALGRYIPDVQYTMNPPPGYPAVGATTVVTHTQEYLDSVHSGAAQLLALTKAEVKACPSTRIIWSGYSQGAELTGDAFLKALKTPALAAHIWAVVLFGDPLYNHLDPGTQIAYLQSDLAQNGILTEPGPLHVGAPHSYPKQADSRVFSFCSSKDPICQGVAGSSPTNGPQNLYTDAGDPEHAAVFLSQH